MSQIIPMAQPIDPRGVGVYVLVILSLALIWLVASLRAVVKLFMIKKVMADDWLMLTSVLLYTAHGGISLWGIINASKVAEADHARGHSIALHSWFLCEVLYALMSALVRTSVAAFLLEVAAARGHRLILYANLAIIWVLCIAYFLIMLFQCNPVSYFWGQVLGQSGSCIAPELVPGATIAHSILSFVTDITLAILPATMLWNVNLDRRTKMIVSTLLGLGVFAGFAMIIRIPFIRFVPIDSPEFLDQANGAGFWSIMETALGIIAGCVATLRPLVRSYRARAHPWFDTEPLDDDEVSVWPQARHPSDNRELGRGSTHGQGTETTPTVPPEASMGTRTMPTRPFAFRSDYLARLSRTRAWVRDGSGNPRPNLTTLPRDSWVQVQTEIEITSEPAPETGPRIPFSFGPLLPDTGQRSLSIHGPNGPVHTAADEPRSIPTMHEFLNRSRKIGYMARS
ncbi:hypothetical protein VTK26DRAFT_5930 [Humicola hyalothermophila]